MPRIKLDLPPTFSFSTQIPVRITDLNYGGHLGNDAVLSLLHEARMQFFGQVGFTELSFAGTGLIMADVAIEYKTQAYYGNVLKVYVTAHDFSRVGFDVYYKLVKEDDKTVVALAKTGMICFDYTRKKVVSVPQEAVDKLHV